MRKKSKYKPKGIRLDNLGWVSAGLRKVGGLPVAGVELKLKNHQALEAVLKGYATRDHIDVLIAAFNISEALYYVNPDLGEDWAQEIRAAQDAIFTMSRRGLKLGNFVFNAPEMAAVKLAMSVHDQQLDDCTVKEMEQAIEYVTIRIKNKQARPIVEAV
ncbi:hypothetical protein UFOVP272_45 [uncultured Caudovirales phage]|uniref:Uncharacterized protein n=1 Tax=uncultured Caudovirales phage TaxID=2100421 RepID=A0A6J5LMS7_9CAUD|nr:hypothetical protein UFOVP272_45 [uncultured Caudovirales phage]